MAGGSQGANAPTGYAGGGYLPSTQFMGGPDSGGDYAPMNMGFDNSGSDGGVGGQPAPMMTPLSAGSRGFAFGGPTQPMGVMGGPQFNPSQPAGGSMGVMGGPQFNPSQPVGGPSNQLTQMPMPKPMGGPSNQLTQMPYPEPAGGTMSAMPYPEPAGKPMGGPSNQLTQMLSGIGNRPPMLSDFRQPKGRQVKGNPTAQLIGRNKFMSRLARG